MAQSTRIWDKVAQSALLFMSTISLLSVGTNMVDGQSYIEHPKTPQRC